MHEGKKKEGCRLGDYFNDGVLNFLRSYRNRSLTFSYKLWLWLRNVKMYDNW